MVHLPAAMGRRTYIYIYNILYSRAWYILYIIIYGRDDVFPPHRGLAREHVRHIFLFLFFKYRFFHSSPSLLIFVIFITVFRRWCTRSHPVGTSL